MGVKQSVMDQPNRNGRVALCRRGRNHPCLNARRSLPLGRDFRGHLAVRLNRVVIKVRPAAASDADALGEIHAASWEAAYAPLFHPDFAVRAVESRRGRWHHRLTEGRGLVLLAELDDRPLALSFCVPSSARPDLAEIYSFYGHPDGWGSGVAGALMAQTLRSLNDDGYVEVSLWTLRSTTQSRRFYAKCGFTESGADRRYDFGDGRLFDQLEYRRPLALERSN